MKIKYLHHFFILLCSFLILSCEQDNMMPEGNWDLSNPAFLQPTDNSNIILDEENANENITFEWQPAISSENYIVTYRIAIAEAGTTDFSDPLVSLVPANGGRDTNVSISYSDLDTALSLAGYDANAEVPLEVAVIASSLSKSSQDQIQLTVKRFTTEILPTRLFISGSASANGSDLSLAVPMKRLNDSNGEPSYVFEVYTHLNTGDLEFYSNNSLPAHRYGGADGILDKSGPAILIEESGEYRVRVDLINNTYQLLRINYWSIVGSPIEGEWGGDAPLSYTSEGTWTGRLDFQRTGGFVFRANGDWAYLLKKVIGSSNNLVMESDAGTQGLSFEDVPNEITGSVDVVLNLSASGYTYSITPVEVNEPLETPDALYLFENGNLLLELNREDNIFKSNQYVPMQASSTYTLNSASDGSGQSYSLTGNLAESTNPDGDSVGGTLAINMNEESFSPVQDRGISLEFNFNNGNLQWKYYNFKLFHWPADNWDGRDEFLMNYVHPNTFTITVNLTAGNDLKFITPWDYQLGSDTPTSPTGDVVVNGGSNINCISTTSSYTVTLDLNNDYTAGTYAFE